MPADDDVTLWISQLSVGDPDAAQAIWEEYFAKLVRYARRKLEDVPRRSFDEDDVAISAMYSFFRGMEAGRFRELDDREDLWKLLLTITARKAFAQRRKAKRKKRGSGLVRGESVFANTNRDSERAWGIAEILGDEPTPELAAEVVENTQRLLDDLEDERAREVVLLRLEGYGNTEIAKKLDFARRTVERKLERIREQWAAEVAEDD